jgi:hypothetical protein
MPKIYQVSFRQARSGGDIDTDKARLQGQQLRGQVHLILLIHGYNNDAHDADDAYGAFCKRQQALVGAGSDWAPGAALVEIYWPGDARWSIASPSYYPWAIPRALEIGSTLAAILADAAQHSGQPLVVDFVAHSLGNRVLLHTVAGLSPAANIWVRRTVHMAGAVPTWTLGTGARTEPLYNSLLRECTEPSRATSFYSGNDMVLALAFPPGETAADTYDHEIPVALGHTEWPGGDAVRLAQFQAPGAGHSNYWGAKIKNKDLDKFLATTINNSLDLGNSSSRSTPTSLSVTRDLPDERSTLDRTLDDRGIGPQG